MKEQSIATQGKNWFYAPSGYSIEPLLMVVRDAQLFIDEIKLSYFQGTRLSEIDRIRLKSFLDEFEWRLQVVTWYGDLFDLIERFSNSLQIQPEMTYDAVTSQKDHLREIYLDFHARILGSLSVHSNSLKKKILRRWKNGQSPNWIDTHLFLFNYQELNSQIDKELHERGRYKKFESLASIQKSIKKFITLFAENSSIAVDQVYGKPYRVMSLEILNVWYVISNERLFKWTPSLNDIEIVLEKVNSKIAHLIRPIRLSSVSQRESIRQLLFDLRDKGHLIINDSQIKEIVNTRFQLIKSSKNESENFRPLNIYPGSKRTSSKIIACLFNKISSFNLPYSKRDIQFWIFALFMNYNGNGFSLRNIEEATDSSSHQMKLVSMV